MIPIVTPAQMRVIDEQAPEPVDELIDRAGFEVARVARSMLGGVYGRRVSIVAGPGNNGADAIVAGRRLARWGARVEIVTPEASSVPACDLVIDGAFGTGMNQDYAPAEVAPGTPILAIDIPSGVDGLTGVVRGSALRATRTITFAALKPGLLLEPGAQCCGEIEVADIGLDAEDPDPAGDVPGPRAWLLTEADAAALLPRRAPNDHKWKRAVFVIGGSAGMFGAPLLASQAALRSGCGLVWCAIPGQTPPGLASEVVFRDLDAAQWHEAVVADGERFGAFVVGPGLGRSAEAAESVQALVARSTRPMVIDGDALRLLGDRPKLRDNQLGDNIVVTPHDGEYEALMGRRPGPDRFAEARALAAQLGVIALLKGPLTIVAHPDGRCVASNEGDQRLATAGAGDVLAGMIGSYLAAGMAGLEAAALGAWIHGAAGKSQPAVGMVASDLLAGLPVAAQQLAESSCGGTNAAN